MNKDANGNLLISNDEEEIQVLLKDNSIAFIQVILNKRCFVNNTIYIQVKTFFKENKNFRISCNITDKFESIAQKIAKQYNNEDILKYTNYRIIICRVF